MKERCYFFSECLIKFTCEFCIWHDSVHRKSYKNEWINKVFKTKEKHEGSRDRKRLCIQYWGVWSYFKDFIYLFLKREERERIVNMWLPLACHQLGTWPTTQTCVLTGNWTSNSLVHRPTFSPLSHIIQGWSLFFCWGTIDIWYCVSLKCTT